MTAVLRQGVYPMHRKLFVAAALISLVVVWRGTFAQEKPPSTATKPPVLKTKFGDIEIFPADNPWNQDVSQLPVHPLSRQYLESIGLDKNLHPDFGTVWQ